ncbi:reverse transcriptase domain-containing protein [Tanacetum coccineum]
MLQRCKDAHLVLNWEKCHFMVKERIVLGHKVSSAGLEVDKAKIDVILKLPLPTNIKSIRSFLRHAGFYRRFIKDFSKIARPLTKLLEKDTPFEFDDECRRAFESLNEKLTCALVIVSPNWNLPFELMCYASDFAIGAVLALSWDLEACMVDSFALEKLPDPDLDEGYKGGQKRPFVLGTPFSTTAKAVIKFDKGTITLRSGKSKISFHRIPKTLCRTENGTKNDIEPIAPTITVNRLVLEWEERIKLHQEKEMKFDQWRSKIFDNERPAPVK